MKFYQLTHNTGGNTTGWRCKPSNAKQACCKKQECVDHSVTNSSTGLFALTIRIHQCGHTTQFGELGFTLGFTTLDVLRASPSKIAVERTVFVSMVEGPSPFAKLVQGNHITWWWNPYFPVVCFQPSDPQGPKFDMVPQFWPSRCFISWHWGYGWAPVKCRSHHKVACNWGMGRLFMVTE